MIIMKHFHRVTEWLKLAGSTGSIWSTIAPAGAPRAGAQSHIQAVSEDLQGGDSTASGQPVPVLRHLYITESPLSLLFSRLLLSQPFLVEVMIQTLCHVSGLLLDCLQYVHEEPQWRVSWSSQYSEPRRHVLCLCFALMD